MWYRHGAIVKAFVLLQRKIRHLALWHQQDVYLDGKTTQPWSRWCRTGKPENRFTSGKAIYQPCSFQFQRPYY